MLRLIFFAFFAILSITKLYGQFVVNDIPAAQPQASIFDPEYNTQLNMVCWKSDDNNLWIGNLNPVTHLYEPSDGKGTYVTGNLSPNAEGSWNGPEWMLSSQGTQLVFNQTIGGIRYPGVAKKIINGWQSKTLYQYPDAAYSMATSDYSDNSAFFLFETSTSNGIYWVRNTNLNRSFYFPDVTLGFFARDNQQICCAGNGARNPGFIEADTTMPYFTAISQDTIGAPFMWNDPATSSRLFMYRTNGNKTIKIFREHTGGQWELYIQFDSPLPDPFQYITSPETFTCNGQSYISFMAAQSGTGKDGLPAQIWVANVDPANFAMWCVSDSNVAVRNDPEPVVFSDSAFIYYTLVLGDIHSAPVYSVRKCDTGLSNLYTAAKQQITASPEITVFPNPGKGYFTLKSSTALAPGSRIEIFDINGKPAYSAILDLDSPVLNLNHLTAGIYVLNIRDHKKLTSTDFCIIP